MNEILVALFVAIVIFGLGYGSGFARGSIHYFTNCPEVHEALLQSEGATRACEQKKCQK